MHTAPLPARPAARRPPRTTWRDVLSFLGLAALLGLAAGLLLGSLALLLATPAYAAERGAGELLMRAGDGSAAFAAPLVATDVVLRVSGPVVRAKVVQTFENPAQDWVEAIYAFPLPENAAVDRLKLKAGERVLVGEIREREAAKAAYARARASGQRASLLDQERPNIFTTQVANIAPRETVVVEIEYQHVLRYEGNRYSLRFPMVIGPRYVPPGVLPVSEVARLSPPVLHPQREGGRRNPVSLRVELDAGMPLAEVNSSYHAVRVEAPSPARRVVTLAEGPVRADRDFELAWVPATGAMPQAAWFVEQAHGRYYGLLVVHPPAPGQAPAPMPREVVYVLDTSGSMGGASLRQAKEALAVALARLRAQDRFNIVEFNSSARALFEAGSREASEANVRAALAWVADLEARGGTEMAPALRLALAQEADPERLKQVLFLTDGAVGNEEALFRIIGERLGGARLFTVGIGSAPNGHFMARAAQLGAGTFTYIGDIAEVRERMGALLAKLEAPAMRNLALEWPDGARVEAWPERMPDLYAGEPLVVSVALDRLEGSLSLHAQRDDEAWRARIALAAPATASGIGGLWAREKIAGSLQKLREGASEPPIRDQVIALALEHQLVTRYTSFVAVDRTPVRADDSPLRQAAVPSLLPAGWEYEKVFGELPQGATDARFALVTGALSMLLGLLLLAIRLRRLP